MVRQLLNSLIVRNRQSDILKDVVLPALTKRVIFLEATKETALSLNIFNALIAINAVTSQRIDQDCKCCHTNHKMSLMDSRFLS